MHVAALLRQVRVSSPVGCVIPARGSLCRTKIRLVSSIAEHPAADGFRGVAAPTGRIASKLSAFTGKADFYEALFFLQDVLLRARCGGSKDSHPAQIQWYSQEKLADAVGFALTKLQYRKIRNELYALSSYMHLPQVTKLLQIFTPMDLNKLVPSASSSKTTEDTTANPVQSRPLETNLGHVDSLGRAISIGKRKVATAKIYLVPGNGECFINGKPAIEYFKRPHEMFKIAEPFRISDSFGEFNAWCLVRGGGLSGQAGAICHALSKAICLLKPSVQTTIMREGLVRRDPRMVERKKPGQPKARKKFTWVKR